MKNNSIKCTYNNCKNEAVGYFVTISSGLWKCGKCGGDSKYAKTTIEEAKSNPKKYGWMFDMFVNHAKSKGGKKNEK